MSGTFLSKVKDPTHRFEGEISPRTEKIAKAVSFIAQPTFLSIPVFILLNLLIDDVGKYVLVTAVSLIFATVIPVAVVYYWSFKLNEKDGDIPNLKDRYIPLVLGVLSYLAGTLVLYFIEAPHITTLLMLCYFVNTIAVFIVSLRWKISIHAIGVVGPTMALCAVYWPWGLLFILILPPVAWSRYVLKKHTPAQLICGAVMGFVITSIMFLLLL